MTTKNGVEISTDVAREANKTVFDDATLAQISNLDDAFRVLSESGMVAESWEDYGSGFSILEDKAQLIRQPFMILEWRFSDGDYGKFVSATVVTKDGRKLILNDGSTGIYEQLKSVTENRVANNRANPQAGLLVEKGLRVSEYDNPAPDAKPGSKSRTYYLAN